MMTDHLQSVEALADLLHDGAKVALGPDYSYCPNAFWRAKLAQGVKDLHLVGVPVLGYQGDMLIGAGAVATVETSAVTLGENGMAPRFAAAAKSASVKILDATCPAIHAGLLAAERGAPFNVMRGLIGSDILARRSDWTVIDNPFAEGKDPIVAIPAIQPDFAIFHAPKADRLGNVWIGHRRELMVMAHAAKQTLVTVEEFVDEDLTIDPALGPGTIPGLYISSVAEAKQGAWPQGIPGGYGPDLEHLARYAQMAKTEEGYATYLNELLGRKEAAE